MQISSEQQSLLHSAAGVPTVFRRLSLVLILIACAFCAMAVLPSTASAKSYTMPKVDIQAQVLPSGDLHVTEQRTFDFSGDFTCVWWTFSGLPSQASVRTNSASYAVQNSDGSLGAEVMLPEVPFKTAWRNAGGPGTDAYSVDGEKNSTYLFFDASDETIVFTFDYTVMNGAVAYKDVADLYWQFNSSVWEVDSQNVTCTISLPLPAGTAVTRGDNIRAWGHGPTNGSVVINDDGSVTYSAPRVSAGQYAEARIVFPTSWLTQVPPNVAKSTADTLHLDSVLSEEQGWADQANAQRAQSIAIVVVALVVSLLLLLYAYFLFRKWGRELKPTFTEKYWRDVPEKDVHPAVIGRLWNWEAERQEDLTASIMHLSAIGAISINKGEYEDATGKKRKDYFLARIPAVAETLKDPVDLATLEFLFDKVAKGGESLWFGTIEDYGAGDPEGFTSSMETWQGALTYATNKQNYFEENSARMRSRIISLIVFYAFVVGAAFFILGGNLVIVAIALPVIALMGVIAHFMSRRTQHGADTYARCQALCNWLKDFSSLEERPPTDVKVWGEFMVYAYQFGIAEEVMKELRTAVPSIFEDDAAMATSQYYVPWWVWYSGDHGIGQSAGSLFDGMMDTTSQTIADIASAVGDAGGFSSGGGFGGGFSVGGGGGFGGGGGAR